LGLKSSKKYQFGSDLIGTLTHAVFENFLGRVKKGELGLDALSDEEIEEMVNEILKEYIKLICGGARESKKLSHLFDRLRKNLYIFVKELVLELKQSSFTPEYFELPMGRKSDDVPPLLFKIGENAKMSLHGICDRVDIFRKGECTYVRVVDYKSGSKKFTLSDISMGKGLQMLIYLYSLCKMGECEFKNQLSSGGEILPAGIMYFPLQLDKARLDKEADLDSEEAAAGEREAISEGIKRSGIYLDDVEIIRAQDSELKGRFLPKPDGRSKGSYVSLEGFEEIYNTLCNTLDDIGSAMLSGDATAKPKEENGRSPCDYCNSRAVCRRRK
jgi:ATP-dependent helicase/nuclease subunit B